MNQSVLASSPRLRSPAASANPRTLLAGLLVLVGLAGGDSGATPGTGTLFGTDASGGNLIRIDPATGVGEIVGFMGIGPAPALALHPTTRVMYAGRGGGAPSVFTIDPLTGLASFVGDSGLGFAAIGAMDFASDGILYAAVNIAGDGGTGSDHLATIDEATGAATIVGSFGSCVGVSVPSFGAGSCTIDGIEAIAFDGSGKLWGAKTARGRAGAAGLYTIDPLTGSATFSAPIVDAFGSAPSGGVSSLQFACDGTLFGGTATGTFAGDGGRLVRIEPDTGRFEFVGSFAATFGRSLGALAFDDPACNQDPICDAAAADPATLWPPNHRLAAISVVGVTDPDGDTLTITPTAVVQDEPVTGEGVGSGNSSPDAELEPLVVRSERDGIPGLRAGGRVNPNALRAKRGGSAATPGKGRGYPNVLRAKRGGGAANPGNGRVYHVDFTADDGLGGSCNGTVKVCVPHQQRPGSACVDDGPIFNSLVAASSGAKVDVCHIPPGEPENAHVIGVSVEALLAHVANHGDEAVPEDDSCTAGVGECAMVGSLTCTSSGLVCDAQPAEPPEAAELTCDDGLDNDCDGLTDEADEDCPDLYFPEGPQVNVPVDDLFGWELCDLRRYGSSTGLALNSILAACDKAKLLLACRPTGSSILTVLAAAPRADVLFDTGISNAPHNANGSGWYFSSDYSWGFADEGDPISRNSCDTASSNASRRLCWHTHQFDVGGWRCGETTGLNFDLGWEKLIYHAD